MQILSNLNLSGNQVQNIVLHPDGSAPTSSAKTGGLYFDSTTGINRVKVYYASAWHGLLDDRDGGVSTSHLAAGAVTFPKIASSAYVNDSSSIASATSETQKLTTAYAVKDYVTNAFKENDAMVYKGTFTAQATSGVTITRAMFTTTGGGHPSNLTDWMTIGYTFKVSGSGYFGTIKVEAGDMIIVSAEGDGKPGTTISNYDVIQANLTNYVTMFGGMTGDIGVRGLNGKTPSTTIGDVNFGYNSTSGMLTAVVVRDTPVVTWEGGTTSGPTLKVKAMGNMSSAVAVPKASETVSGVVTTDNQTFAGSKTFAGSILPRHDAYTETSNLSDIGSASQVWHEVNAQTLHLWSKIRLKEIVSGSETTTQTYDSDLFVGVYPCQSGSGANQKKVDTWCIYSYEPTSGAKTGMGYAPMGFGCLTPDYGLFFTGESTDYNKIATRARSWGVGTMAPQYLFHVNGTFGAGSTANKLFEVESAGVVKINNDTDCGITPAGALQVSGGAYIAKNLMVRGNGNSTGHGGKIFFTDSDYIELVIHDSVKYLHTNLPFYSDSSVSGGGISSSGGGGGGGMIQHVYASSDLGGTYSDAATDDTFNAYTINYIWGNLNGRVSSLDTSVTSLINGAVQDVTGTQGTNNVVTGISKSGSTLSVTYGSALMASAYTTKDVTLNGTPFHSVVESGESAAVTLYAPTSVGAVGQVLLSSGNGAPTWGELKHVNLSEVSSANFHLASPGLEVFRATNMTGAPTESGSILQWDRYTNGSGVLVNMSTQLYAPASSNRLYYRNSRKAGAPLDPATSADWATWAEVLTTESAIHSYDISRSSASTVGTWNATSGSSAYQSFTAATTFATDNLVPVLYDSNKNLVMADIQIVSNKVVVTFAQGVKSGESYKLVVYGI